MKSERLENILNFIKQNKQVSVQKICKTFFYSEASVRRDLKSLADMNLIVRTYGGAMLRQYDNSIQPFVIREQQAVPEKTTIAEKASSLIQDGDIIMLDQSTITHKLVGYLSRLKDITVFTNCLQSINQLSNMGIKTYCIGGLLDAPSKALIGSYAQDFVSTIYADVLFFSAKGLSKEGRISDPFQENAALRKTMIKHSKKKVFLCQTSKIDSLYAYDICGLDEIDYICCETTPPDYVYAQCKNVLV